MTASKKEWLLTHAPTVLAGLLASCDVDEWMSVEVVVECALKHAEALYDTIENHEKSAAREVPFDARGRGLQ